MEPAHDGCLGAWGQLLIEWTGEMTATADDADNMIAGLQEMARIGREWECEQ